MRATSIQRALHAFTLALLLGPGAGHGEPVLANDPSSYSVTGWSNAIGQFVIDPLFGASSPPVIDGIGEVVSFSAAASSYSLRSTRLQIVTATQNLTGGRIAVDMQIDADIRGDGTPTGHLNGGSLVLRAGADGVPALGISAGETLLVGTMIDDAALDVPYDTAFLFQLTFRNAALPDFGTYLTYLNPEAGTWGSPSSGIPYEPWSRDVARTNFGFDDWFLHPTRLMTPVPEPQTVAMWLLGLAVVAYGLRSSRKRSAP